MKAHRLLLFSIAAAVSVAAAAWALAAPALHVAGAALAVMLAPTLVWAVEHRLKLATWEPASRSVEADAKFVSPQTGQPQATAFA